MHFSREETPVSLAKHRQAYSITALTLSFPEIRSFTYAKSALRQICLREPLRWEAWGYGRCCFSLRVTQKTGSNWRVRDLNQGGDPAHTQVWPHCAFSTRASPAALLWGHGHHHPTPLHFHSDPQDSFSQSCGHSHASLTQVFLGAIATFEHACPYLHSPICLSQLLHKLREFKCWVYLVYHC